VYNYIGLGLEHKLTACRSSSQPCTATLNSHTYLPKLTARRYAREYIGGEAAAMHFGNLKFGQMEFVEMKRNTSMWSNFGMLLRRAGLTASAGLSCLLEVWFRYGM